MAIIPDARCVTWTGNVGVNGDIPNRGTIFCDATQEPYNADPTGVSDSASAIQAAISACTVGQVVYLPAGTYKIGSRIAVKTGITLRGAGPESTIIQGASGFSGLFLVGFYNSSIWYDGEFETSKTILGGLTKGSTQINVTSHGYSAGDIVLIDVLNNPTGDPKISNEGVEGPSTYLSRASGARVSGQVAKVVSGGDSSHFNIEIPIYYPYDMDYTPQVTRYTQSWITRDAGIENLTVDNSLSGSTKSEMYGDIQMQMCDGCWLLNVKLDTVKRAGIKLYEAYRCTIRSCEAVNSLVYTSNGGYGLLPAYGVSACLVEDSYFHNMAIGPILNGPTSGNVFAYNYITDMVSTDYPNAVRQGMSMHGGHPLMNLFEGNYFDGCQFIADYYHGSSSHNTFFRNMVAIDTSKTSGTTDIALFMLNTYYNFVGNVLGTNGFETTYQGSNFWSGINIYVMDQVASPLVYDGMCASTALQHGNWDYVSDAVVWDEEIDDHDIPDSLYLESKPSWWGSGIWPTIGSDMSPMAGLIPADPDYVPTPETIEWNQGIGLRFT